MKRKLSTENDALARFGAPLQDLTPHDLLDPDGFFRMGHPPVIIEILSILINDQRDTV
jgi:hypothetical protein